MNPRRRGPVGLGYLPKGGRAAGTAHNEALGFGRHTDTPPSPLDRPLPGLGEGDAAFLDPSDPWSLPLDANGAGGARQRADEPLNAWEILRELLVVLAWVNLVVLLIAFFVGVVAR